MSVSEIDDVVKRMTVTMEDDLYEQVEAIAKEQERTVPNLLVYLARLAVKEREESADTEK